MAGFRLLERFGMSDGWYGVRLGEVVQACVKWSGYRKAEQTTMLKYKFQTQEQETDRLRGFKSWRQSLELGCVLI